MVAAQGYHRGLPDHGHSYLTFLVEHGWMKSLGIIPLFTAFWIWTRPSEKCGKVSTGLCGSIIAFLVAVFFSTIMEEPKLWLLPGFAAVILIVLALITRQRLSRSEAITYAGIATISLSVIFAIGWKFSMKDPLLREMTFGANISLILGPESFNQEVTWLSAKVSIR